MRKQSMEHTVTCLACVPLAVFLICVLIVLATQGVAGSSLRGVPRCILGSFGCISIGVFLVWINARYKDYMRKRGHPSRRSVTTLAKGISIALFIYIVLAEIVVQGFGHKPEHVVEKHGMKMVAVVNSFLDETVYYYEYQNALFYGKQLGFEWYGNGGGDPLTREPAPEPISWWFCDKEGVLISQSPDE